MCEVASFNDFENGLTTVVMTKTKVAAFYLGHGVVYFLFIYCLTF